MLWMTSKHQVPWRPRLEWLAWNVAIGWGAIDEFYECSESPPGRLHQLMPALYEKVRHVYKQTDVGDIGPYVKETVVTSEKKQQ